MKAQAERTLQLTLGANLDAGREHWFENCSAANDISARHRLRPAERVIHDRKVH